MSSKKITKKTIARRKLYRTYAGAGAPAAAAAAQIANVTRTMIHDQNNDKTSNAIHSATASPDMPRATLRPPAAAAATLLDRQRQNNNNTSFITLHAYETTTTTSSRQRAKLSRAPTPHPQQQHYYNEPPLSSSSEEIATAADNNNEQDRFALNCVKNAFCCSQKSKQFSIPSGEQQRCHDGCSLNLFWMGLACCATLVLLIYISVSVFGLHSVKQLMPPTLADPPDNSTGSDTPSTNDNDDAQLTLRYFFNKNLSNDPAAAENNVVVPSSTPEMISKSLRPPLKNFLAAKSAEIIGGSSVPQSTTTNQCDANFTNAIVYEIRKTLPPSSRWRACVHLQRDTCQIKLTFLHFMGSTTHTGSDLVEDSVQLYGRTFTGSSWNGMTLSFDLDNNKTNFAVEILFATAANTFSSSNDAALALRIEQVSCEVAPQIAPDCSQQLVIDQSAQTILSSTGQYANNLDCRADLNVPATACGLNLLINSMSVDGMPVDCMRYDYLQINGRLFCGQLTNKHVLMQFSTNINNNNDNLKSITEGNKDSNTLTIPILWHTDSSFVSTGFNVSYGWLFSCNNNNRRIINNLIV